MECFQTDSTELDNSRRDNSELSSLSLCHVLVSASDRTIAVASQNDTWLYHLSVITSGESRMNIVNGTFKGGDLWRHTSGKLMNIVTRCVRSTLSVT